MARISTARFLHDVGLAVWCGGSLMGATGLNGAASTLDDPAQRGRAVNEGWQRWAPINAAAIGAHLVGGALIVRENRSRIAGQQGVAAWTAAKTVLTAAALASTVASGWFGRKTWSEHDLPVEGATTPSSQTPPQAAQALSAQKVLQWTTPALTAAVIAASSTMSEQQRPGEVISGALGRTAQSARHPKAAAQALRQAI